MTHIRPYATVESALRASDAGVTDRSNAEAHGVSVKTIRRWRRDYQRRGKPRGQTHASVPCPRCDAADLDEAAYAELLGWYLGDGHISTDRKGVHALHVFNDAAYSADIERIRMLLAAVKVGGRPHVRTSSGCAIVTCSWKHWVCLFPQHGIGRKHERPIALADWQQAIVDEHPHELLRGLFHSDGCRVTNWTVRRLAAGPKRYEYLRYLFSNESPDIIGICAATLDQVGVHWTLPRRNVLSVARQADVATLDTFIGPKS